MVTISPDELARPLWRRARFWLALAAVLVIVAVALGSLFDSPGRPLDPTSPAKDGSKALARITEGYGIRVTGTDSLDTALKAAGRSDTTVVVISPDHYSTGQLRSLREADQLVLVQPSDRTVADLVYGAAADDVTGAEAEPGCDLRAATAAGDVEWPGDESVYRAPDTQSCYGGGVLEAGGTGGIVLLGSSALLTNDSIDDRGAAALAVNLTTIDRSASEVVWLLPGSDAGGEGSASIWQLFPDGAYRVFWWLAAVGVLIVLWRARRLGGVVTEPLPVVVRAAELVEGHGRLYERAGARDRAAQVLRRSTQRRVAERLGLSPRSTTSQVAAAAASRAGRPEQEIAALLDGPAPSDDAGLMRLAAELDQLVEAIGGNHA